MGRILLVDDSATQLLQIAHRLKEEGFEVQTAKNGEEALQVLATNTEAPHLILTDIQMPVMDGLELVQEARKQRPGLPVVLMTANGSEDLAMEALKIGATNYIPKHLLDTEIDRTLKTIVSLQEKARRRQKIHEFLTGTETHLTLGNDPEMISPLISYLEDEMALYGLTDESVKNRVVMVLREALENAIYHGNLEVSSELRESDNPTYYKVASERREQAPYQERRVYVTSKLSPEEAIYVIRDEGPGFDKSKLPDPTDPARIIAASGRGLLLINTFMDDVEHNDSGNQITMVKKIAG